MQRLEVSGAVRLIYRSLGVKGLTMNHQCLLCWWLQQKINTRVTETVVGILSTASATRNDHDSIPGPFGSSLSIGPIAILSRYRSSGRLTAVKRERTTGVRSPVRNISFSVPFRRAPESIRTQFGEDQYILRTRALVSSSDADGANFGGTKPQKMQREKTYTDSATVRFVFRNVRRFSRNYTVFMELHGFHGTTRFSRN